MNACTALNCVGHIKGFEAFQSRLKKLLKKAGVTDDVFENCVNEQLDSPSTYCDAEGKLCEPERAVVRLFKTPFLLDDGNTQIFISFDRSNRDGGWVGAKFVTADGEVSFEDEPMDFELLDGGSVVDFERELYSAASEAPVLLVSVMGKMSVKGFRWAGKPKNAIAAMECVTVIQDKRKDPVHFVVRRDKVLNREYLRKNPDFVFDAECFPDTNRNVRVQCDMHFPDDLFEFAYVPESRYIELANQALPENWTIVRSQPYGVLIQYLKYTFMRASHQAGALKVADNKYAVFNTGLVDKNYDWLYAYFEPNINVEKQQWCLVGFFTAGNRGENGLGKRALLKVGSMPARVTWLSPQELYFDTSIDVFVDWKHILQQRASRLPAKFIQRYVDNGSEIDELYEKLEVAEASEGKYFNDICSQVEGLAANGEEGFVRYRGRMLSNWDLQRLNRDLIGTTALRQCIDDYFVTQGEIEKLYADIQLKINSVECEDARFELISRLDTAIKLSRKKVMWDYATAVPIYYPEHNTFGFLLPLSLCNSKEVDVALVVSKTKTDVYQGQTILTKEMAYSNARLLRKPDAQWISKWTER